MLTKKYGNRRLYDAARSRYITLEELAEIVRREDSVRVVDAKTGEDLTTSTLAQIIVEGRGAARLVPVPLLVQLPGGHIGLMAGSGASKGGWPTIDAWLSKRSG